jgi:hypothetical protein
MKLFKIMFLSSLSIFYLDEILMYYPLSYLDNILVIYVQH